MNARLNSPTIIMTLVRSQRFQPLPRFSPQSTRLGWKPPYDPPVPSHRRARLACDLAAAGADGAGAMVRPIAPNGAQSAYRYQSAWRVEGDTRPHPDGSSQEPPAHVTLGLDPGAQAYGVRR